MARRWPAASEYVAAVQELEVSFGVPGLRSGQWVPGWMGLPACATGQNAVVFPIVVDGVEVAVKCFTAPAGDGRRYSALAAHLVDHPCRSLAEATWVEEGVRVAGQWWPVATMPWLEGHCLHDWVGERLSDPQRIGPLAERWRKAVEQLGAAGIAHGDLQHGNILIGSRSRIRLVDYDSVWVSEIADVAPREVGHPNYQHPQRRELGLWGRYVDWFSALVIYVSLRAVAAEPDLWSEYHNGENLILCANDYLKPGTSPIWDRLANSSDTEVPKLTQLLHKACRADADIPANLNELLTTQKLPRPNQTPLPKPATRQPPKPVTRETTKPVTRETTKPVTRETTKPVTRETTKPWWAEARERDSQARPSSPVTARAHQPKTDPESTRRSLWSRFVDWASK
jgi:serine/threonine protein kinase